MRNILGISAFYHDSAAALVQNGVIVAAAQEERFTRRKNDEQFPHHAVEYCLREGRISAAEVDAVVFYDKPIVKFGRLLETALSVAPAGLIPFIKFVPTWLGEKLNLRKTIGDELPGLSKSCRFLFTQHHQSHAASAFFPSPFSRAAILTVDGVGEWATTTIGRGVDNQIEMLKEIRFPHSLGLLYSAFTAYCGFRINSGEYKLMGLAPYGEPKYASLIRDKLIDLKEDGSFALNLEYFEFLTGLRMTNRRFDVLFGGPSRQPEGAMERRFMDVARSIQIVTEEVMLRLARHARAVTGESRLCLAGGVALNCVANGRLWRERVFDDIWIQPAAGDAGGALGAALAAWYAENPRSIPPTGHAARDAMKGSLLGPSFTNDEVQRVLDERKAVYEKMDEAALLDRVAELIDEGNVIGWVQGRLEFGPRALGNRSILGDARNAVMQSRMNLKIKFRESFRPFAPVVLRERVGDYFDLDADSPYMLLVAPVKESLRRVLATSPQGSLESVKEVRSTIPAVTHVDFSARIQTVGSEENPLLHRLLKAFEKKTGEGLLVNTSFNVRGEPIVCSPGDAYRCFVNTEMDYLAIGNFLLKRELQPKGNSEEPRVLPPD